MDPKDRINYGPDRSKSSPKIGKTPGKNIILRFLARTRHCQLLFSHYQPNPLQRTLQTMWKCACVCAGIAGVFLPAAVALPTPANYYGAIVSLPAVAAVPDSLYLSITKTDHGEKVSDYVDLIFRAVDSVEPEEEEEHEEHDEHEDEHGDEHEGHDEKHDEVHEEAVAFYNKTLITTDNCTTYTSVNLTADFQCIRVAISDDYFATYVAIDASNGQKMVQYMAFFEGHEDEHDEDEPDEHEGHEDEHDEHDEHDEEEVEFSEIFQMKSSSTGLPVNPLTTFSSDEHELDSHTEEESPMWKPILAAFLVNLCTLSGVIFVTPVVKKYLLSTTADATVANDDASEKGMARSPSTVAVPEGERQPHSHGSLDSLLPPSVIALTSAFSSGAILSAAVLLVLPEAMQMLEKSVAEPDLVWMWGSFVLAGFVFPFFLNLLTSISFPSKFSDGQFCRTSAIVSVLLGDGFHNFADGCFIGAAFMSCDSAFGWSVALSTIIHEFAQEIADFFVLTGIGGLKPLTALCCNFTSGFSVMFGVLIVIHSGISDILLGYILAFGGGIYIQIGATECMPRAFENLRDTKLTFKCLMMFIVGAVAIGLVLLDHKHCEIEGAEAAEGHEGHGH